MSESDTLKVHLHIELLKRPAPSNQQVSIRDETGTILFHGESSFGDEGFLRRILQQITIDGVKPEAVYIEPFSGILDDVKSVWPDVEVLFEYQ